MNTDNTKSRNSQQIATSLQHFKRLTSEQQKKVLQAALPDQWLQEVTGESFWEKQTEIARAVAKYPRVAVASCNSAGKSFLAARLAMWFMLVFAPCVVVTTAPTGRQVKRILWREIHNAYEWARFRGIDLGGRLLMQEWTFGPNHTAFGFATRDYDATAFQGIHAERLFIIADEAAGLSESIWEGIFSVLKGGFTRLLAIGNPTTTGGRFYQAFHNPNWWSTNISAFETPNLKNNKVVIKGLVTPDDVEQARWDWGEGSPLWQARIEGRFPEVLEDTLIPVTLIQNAGQGDWTWEDIREIDQNSPVEIGADHARYGNDRNVYVARRGRIAFHSLDFGADALRDTGVMSATGHLVKFVRESLTALGKPKARTIIKCDAVGLGGGVPDRLRELQQEGEIPRTWEIVDMNDGQRPRDTERFLNAGAEWWKTLEERLRSEEAFGPVFAEKSALAQLSQRRYEITSAGKLKLESKEQMLKRGIKSPDWGDAIAMAYAQPVEQKVKAGAWGRS